MRQKQKISIPAALYLSLILMLGGYATAAQAQDSNYVSQNVCYEESEVFDLWFLYLCEESQKAQVASAVCDLMAASAYMLIETNRRIGPTTPENLFAAAGIESLPAIRVLYRVLGEDAAKAYINDIADMSIDIANRNITDLVTYPRQEFDACLEQFGYIARK